MMIWEAIRDLFAQKPHVPQHDETVHRLREEAGRELAKVHFAVKESRRLSRQAGNSEDVNKKLREANRIICEARRMIDDRNDTDDGLLRGMDQSLNRGDDA